MENLNPTDTLQSKKPAGRVTLWSFLTRPSPYIKDLRDQSQAQLLAAISLSLLLVLSIAVVSILLVDRRLERTTAMILIEILLVVSSYILSRSWRYRIGASLLVWSFALLGFAIAYAGPENISYAFDSTIPPALIVASVFLPLWEIILLGSLCTIGLFVVPLPSLSPADAGTIAGVFITVMALIVVTTIFRNTLERKRLNELDAINKELVSARDYLEQRVEERTAELKTTTYRSARRANQLQTIAEVARRISFVQDITPLLQNITKLISERFGYYHVGIFLLDTPGEYAVLQASNSEGGQRMLARNHKLKVGEVGIVGFVTAHAEPRIALDVGTDAVFFDNPDLPDTRSEMALPLLIGSRVIGALDVQSTEPAAFVEEDVEVMRVLADQVAIAIENTRLFETTRRALADAELIYSQYVRQEWQKFNLELPIIGYQVTPSGVEAIKHPIEKSEIRTALKSGKSSTVAGDQPSMTVPLVVRGEVIGVINIRCRDSARRLNENDALIVQAVAERAAMALENYRLLQDAQRRALRERAIGEVSTKITAAPEMDAIMRTTVQELGRRLGEAEVIFQLSEPQEEQ